MVAHPGEGVALDGVLGQLGQVRPGLQAARVLGRHGGHRIPTSVGREGPSRVEGGGEARGDGVEDGLGAAGGEFD